MIAADTRHAKDRQDWPPADKSKLIALPLFLLSVFLISEIMEKLKHKLRMIIIITFILIVIKYILLFKFGIYNPQIESAIAFVVMITTLIVVFNKRKYKINDTRRTTTRNKMQALLPL